MFYQSNMSPSTESQSASVPGRCRITHSVQWPYSESLESIAGEVLGDEPWQLSLKPVKMPAGWLVVARPPQGAAFAVLVAERFHTPGDIRRLIADCHREFHAVEKCGDSTDTGPA
jgi:hypothetical protein